MKKKRQKIRRKFAAPKQFNPWCAAFIRAAFINPQLLHSLTDTMRAINNVLRRQAEKARFYGLVAPNVVFDYGYPSATVRKAPSYAETLQQVLHELNRLLEERAARMKFRAGGIVSALGGEYVINNKPGRSFVELFGNRESEDAYSARKRMTGAVLSGAWLNESSSLQPTCQDMIRDLSEKRMTDGLNSFPRTVSFSMNLDVTGDAADWLKNLMQQPEKFNYYAQDSGGNIAQVVNPPLGLELAAQNGAKEWNGIPIERKGFDHA